MVNRSRVTVLLLLLCALVLVVCGEKREQQKSNPDGTNTAPTLVHAYWSPSPVEYDSLHKAWASHIVIGICDPDDDLAGGGIYPLLHGTAELIWPHPMRWTDFYDLPDVSKCNDPEWFAVPCQFASLAAQPGIDEGELCIDLYVTDGEGLFSRKLENICVRLP